MCLSTVYLDKKDPRSILLEEASSITAHDGSTTVVTLFGERKTVDGYMPGELNLLEHYVILTRSGDTHAVKKRAR
jgi:hypothetical protein